MKPKAQFAMTRRTTSACAALVFPMMAAAQSVAPSTGNDREFHDWVRAHSVTLNLQHDPVESTAFIMRARLLEAAAMDREPESSRAAVLATLGARRATITEMEIFRAVEQFRKEARSLEKNPSDYTLLNQLGASVISRTLGPGWGLVLSEFDSRQAKWRAETATLQTWKQVATEPTPRKDDLFMASLMYSRYCRSRECVAYDKRLVAPYTQDSLQMTTHERYESKNELQTIASRKKFDDLRGNLTRPVEPTLGNSQSPTTNGALPAMPELRDIAPNYAAYLEDRVGERPDATSAERIYATGQIATTLLMAAGRPIEAQAMSTLASGTSQMIAVLGGSGGDLVKAGAVMGGIGAVFMTASILSSSGERSQTQAILEALQQISEQIAQLHQLTARGFFRTEVRLDALRNEVDFGFDRLYQTARLAEENISSLLAYRLIDQTELAQLALSARELAISRLLYECSDVADSSHLEACEQRLVTGALFDSQYTLRGEGVMWATMNDPRFRVPYVFHPTYGHLLDSQGTNSASRDVIDLYDWNRHVRDLIRLQERAPAQTRHVAGRRAAHLAKVALGAERSIELLAHLSSRATLKACDEAEKAVPSSEDSQSSPDLSPAAAEKEIPCDPVEQAADRYFSTVLRLPDLARDLMSVSPRGDVANLDPTTLPEPGSLRRYLETQINGSYGGHPTISTCKEASDQNFAPTQDPKLGSFVVQYNKRARLTADDWNKGWDRKALDKKQLDGVPFLDVVPAPAIWAQAYGFGGIRVCLSKFRPTSVEFTDKKEGKRHRLANAKLEVEVATYFEPTTNSEASRLFGDQPVLLATKYAELSCRFTYRHEFKHNGDEYQRRGHTGTFRVLRKVSEAWAGSSACGETKPRDTLVAQEVSEVVPGSIRKLARLVEKADMPVAQDLATRVKSSAAFLKARLAYTQLLSLQTLNATLSLHSAEQIESSPDPSMQPAPVDCRKLLTKPASPVKLLPDPDGILSLMMEKRVDVAKKNAWHHDQRACIVALSHAYKAAWKSSMVETGASWIDDQLEQTRTTVAALRVLAQDYDMLLAAVPEAQN